MGTNDVFDTEANEDLIAKSVIDIAKECICVTYSLYLSRSAKDLLMNNFLRIFIIFLKNKKTRSSDIRLTAIKFLPVHLSKNSMELILKRRSR